MGSHAVPNVNLFDFLIGETARCISGLRKVFLTWMPRLKAWLTDHGQSCDELYAMGPYAFFLGGGAFFHSCAASQNLPRTRIQTSLSRCKICAPRTARRWGHLSSFSFKPNISARVNARKLEVEQKKSFSPSLCKFSRNNSSRNAWYAVYRMVPFASSPVSHVLRSPLCSLCQALR